MTLMSPRKCDLTISKLLSGPDEPSLLLSVKLFNEIISKSELIQNSASFFWTPKMISKNNENIQMHLIKLTFVYKGSSNIIS